MGQICCIEHRNKAKIEALKENVLSLDKQTTSATEVEKKINMEKSIETSPNKRKEVNFADEKETNTVDILMKKSTTEEITPNKQRSISQTWKKQKKKSKDVKETHNIKRFSSDQGIKSMNNYRMQKVLGEGAFGKVKLAVKEILGFEKTFAIKIYKKAQLRKKKSFVKDKDGKMSFKDALQAVSREIAVMKKLDHPNVVRLHEVLDDDEKDKLYLVLDFCAKGQLIEWDDEIEKFFFCDESHGSESLEEEKLKDIFRECLTGLHYLHINHIIHRDIKPQNILFDENNRVKIADFGQSFLFENISDKMENTEGTYWFMAPETLDPTQNSGGYSGVSADIWSLGVTFYAFVFLKVPFFGNNIFELLENIKTKDLEFPAERQVSDGIKNVLRMMIEKNPIKRASLIDLIKEPWLNVDRPALDEEIKNLEEVIIGEADVAISLERAVFLKRVVKKFKSGSQKKLI